MFLYKGLEEKVNLFLSSIDKFNVGIGTSDKDSSDEGLENEVLRKSVLSQENKGNGEYLVVGEVDYTEANGYDLTENGLLINNIQLTADNNYSLQKNSGEKYVYYFNCGIYPSEKL